MGCGNSKEKLEDEMIKLKFQRAQIQMERKNQIKILEERKRKNQKRKNEKAKRKNEKKIGNTK